jgi:hypothetical protein
VEQLGPTSIFQGIFDGKGYQEASEGSMGLEEKECLSLDQWSQSRFCAERVAFGIDSQSGNQSQGLYGCRNPWSGRLGDKTGCCNGPRVVLELQSEV